MYGHRAIVTAIDVAVFAAVIAQEVVSIDEGIVASEGVYVAKYFLGGSHCCVAESEAFKVSGTVTY